MSILETVIRELLKMRDTLLGNTSKISLKEREVASNWDVASIRDTR